MIRSLIFVLLVTVVVSFNDFPGPYCKTRYPRASNGICCNNRLDSCSVPISSTLCYCDEFCDQHNNPDCCPDYQSHCKGLAPTPIISCEVDGVYFTPFDPSQMINCNLCKCQQDGKALCEIDSCLSNIEMIKDINTARDVSWTAKNYTEFFGRKYKEGLELRLGTFEPVRRVSTMSRLSNGQKQLPNSFNSLENWPGLISEVRDQGWCGSSWAVSTASVASDRFSVKSKGQEMVEIAPQQLLSCAKRQQGCNGGHLDIAWNYFRRWGGVDEDCYPYVAKVNTCRVPDKRQSTLRSLGCSLPTKVARTDLYKMGPAYSLNNETDIMAEIYHHGPVQATMRVYHDFFTYQTGVYSHTRFGTDQRSGFHSVRLIGWGQEDNGYKNVKYWIAANSWGKWWGEDGFFQIVRGSNECEIENYVLSSLPVIQDKHIVFENI
ncbi:unnamed protein product [Diamesa hyperborea]